MNGFRNRLHRFVGPLEDYNQFTLQGFRIPPGLDKIVLQVAIDMKSMNTVPASHSKAIAVCLLLSFLLPCMPEPANAAQAGVSRSRKQSWDVQQSLALARRQEHQKKTIQRLLAQGKPAAASRYLRRLPTTPCCLTQIDWLIRELDRVNEFDEALALCDNYEVGSNNGKPYMDDYVFSQCLFGSSPSYIHGLHAKVLLDSGDRLAATKHALRAWYCAEVCKWENKDVKVLMQTLNVAAPPLDPIVSGNDRAFAVIDDLCSRSVLPAKRELEELFGRPFSLSERTLHVSRSNKPPHDYASYFETDLFPVVRTSSGGCSGLTVFIHVEQAYITRTDLEKHFGPGDFHAGVRKGCRDEPDTIAFLRDGRLITFELYPDQSVPTHKFDIMWMD